MSLVIAGDRSGVGKTTITLALLASLKRRQLRVQSFKVGPDYIDPMFHQAVTGRSSRNLDPVLTSEAYVQRCFFTHAQTADYALVEGVMGLFDGAAGRQDWASTAHIARLLQLPILLVLDCSHLSGSVAAIAHGYRCFDPRLQLAGVVLNRVGSDRHLALLKAALEPLNLSILGVLRRNTDITIPDRHLGLVPTHELPELRRLIDRLADLGDTCFDWTALLPLLSTTGSIEPTPNPLLSQGETPDRIRIAIARDLAFNFYYADNLEVLEQFGAELIFWSPLEDTSLPQGIQGLYFGGGFPEMFAQTLAENQAARHSVKAAIQAGMPTYAECGGLMYLCQSLQDLAGYPFEMVGILPTKVTMADRLILGYRQATALRDTSLVATGMKIWGHEFHRSALNQPLDSPIYDTAGYWTPFGEHQLEGWYIHYLHASYVHLHWGEHPDLPQRFLHHCQTWSLT